jgi:hypothetical protein
MSRDRQLIDAIKTHFTRRSMAQLQAIARGDAGDRWSPEAVMAAGEVIRDRLAGHAQEPPTPAEDDEPPEFHYEPEQVALGVLAGLMTGYLVVPHYRRVEVPDLDLPVPFGPRMAWLAVDAADTDAVAKALGLWKPPPATWRDGIEAAHHGSVFITPPVGDWTLVVGSPLFVAPDRTATAVRSLLERFGRHFPDVQYFCNHPDVRLYAWARATEGRLVRGYGWLGAQSRILWEEGTPTPHEDGLGFRFAAGQPPRVDPNDGGDPTPFSEDGLFQLASCWSVDPTTLDCEFLEPMPGLLGKITL